MTSEQQDLETTEAATVSETKLRKGAAITVDQGENKGKKGKVTGVLPTHDTVRGKEARYMYKTNVGPEHYRSQDLSV